MKIAVIDKSLNNTRYDKHFGIKDIAVFHMCSRKLEGRLLKKDIDLGTENNPFEPSEFEYVILIGAEPFKAYAGKTGISDYSGKRVSYNGYDNWIASISPAMLHFKPEMKPVFESTVENIHAIINGNERVAKSGDWKPIQDEDAAEAYVKMVYTMMKGPVAFDSETSALYSRDGYVLGLSMSHEEYQGVYIESDAITETVVYYIQKILDTPDRPIVFHNLKFDMHMYKYHFGFDFEQAYRDRRLHDTMLQHYVLDERRGTHGLKALAMKFTDMGDYDFELDQFKANYCKTHGIKKEDFSYDLIPFDIMWPYACLTHDSLVKMATGEWKTIGELVRNKSSEEVVSFNETTGQYENKQITGWYKNKHESKEWRKLDVLSQQRNKSTLNGPVFTPDHRVLTQNGYKEVQDLDIIKDRILTEELAISNSGIQVVLGSLLGDGSLVSKNNRSAGLSLAQSEKHKEYLDFKVSSQPGTVSIASSTHNGNKAFTASIAYSSEYGDLYRTLETRDNTSKYKLKWTEELTSRLTVEALAILYQDDGSLPNGNPRIWARTIAGDRRQQDVALNWLRNLGIEARYHTDGANNQFFVLEGGDFFPLVAPYIHSSMSYKVPDRYKYLVGTARWDFSSTEYYYAKIYGIEAWVAPESRRGYATSWCIDVEDNHNFVTKVGVVHNCKDTDATLRLHNFFLPKIEKNDKLAGLYYDLLIPGTMFLTRVEDRGVPVSKDRLKEVQIQLMERLRESEEELYTYAEVHALEKAQGKQFNPGSVAQLRVLLFDYLNLTPTGKLTGTGAISTDAEVLQELAEQHPLAKTLLTIRKTKKLISTYVEKILQSIDADGRVRTGFHLQTTTSGRLSSSGKFNLQQLPRDESAIKGAIVAPPGYVIIAWDLTTAEVYVAAVLSGDRNLQQIFIDMRNDPENSADFHSMIAHMVFNPGCTAKELKKLYPSLRQASKAITFGINRYRFQSGVILSQV